jgi:hypothetical protein
VAAATHGASSDFLSTEARTGVKMPASYLAGLVASVADVGNTLSPPNVVERFPNSRPVAAGGLIAGLVQHCKA